MEWVIAVIGVLAFLIVVLLFLILPAGLRESQKEQFYRRNYAHRGLHEKDCSVPENSLQAFSLAASKGYGIELDIQLSKDGQVVVFHDDTLDRVCGVRGQVDAFDWKDLKQMHLCGTQERIPLFTEVLKLVAGRVPLIVELKTGPNNTELCEKSLALLKAYSGPYCVESFDPRIVAWFRKHARTVLRGQLSSPPGNLTTLKPLTRFALGNLLTNVIARPQFIAYQEGPLPLTVRLCRALGAMKVVWTVRSKESEERLQKTENAIIFEFFRPKTQW